MAASCHAGSEILPVHKSGQHASILFIHVDQSDAVDFTSPSSEPVIDCPSSVVLPADGIAVVHV